MSRLLGVPVGAAYHLVFALAQFLSPVAGGLAAAAAIVLFTAAVRLLISPLSFRALRAQAAMARLAPQVKALRTRYGRQPERFSQELTALYQREGTGPFASVIPLLAQWPFLSVMYLLFRSATVSGAANRLLSDALFRVPLGARWLPVALLSGHDAVFLGILASLAALCWLSARLARRSAPAPAGSPGPSAGLLGRVLPYITVVFAAFSPLAAVLYLLTCVAWTIGERWLFLGRSEAAVTTGGSSAGLPVALAATGDQPPRARPRVHRLARRRR
jgi:YidC/Oxa1 family membrane protein insertase